MDGVTLRDGTVLWTAVTGSGPPVIVLHGGPGLWDYLGPLAAMLDDEFTVIRFDQRGCGRSGGTGPFTVAQAIDDVDQVRAAFGFQQWAVLGHSWGAELALRYGARHPQRTTAIAYVAGVGADDSFRDPYVAERDRRLGHDLGRWRDLAARARTADEEREWCLLQWRPDFAPGSPAAEHAAALWTTRPAGSAVNSAAGAELWADRARHDLVAQVRGLDVPVAMVFGADDPRPWSAAEPVLQALPHATRTIVDGAGHAPWVEQPDATLAAIRPVLRARREPHSALPTDA